MSKENDDWFEGITECFSCGSKKLKREIIGKREILRCTNCGIPNAGQSVV